MGQVTARAGRFAQTLVNGGLATRVALRGSGRGLREPVQESRQRPHQGNKQTVFTHEQLEAYQVGMMDQAIGGFGSLVVFLAEEMGTASLHPGGVGGAVSKRPWGGSVCGFRQQWAVGEEEALAPTPAPASGRVWVKLTSLSTGLHLLHEKGNHEVSLMEEGKKSWALYMLCSLTVLDA